MRPSPSHAVSNHRQFCQKAGFFAMRQGNGAQAAMRRPPANGKALRLDQAAGEVHVHSSFRISHSFCPRHDRLLRSTGLATGRIDQAVQGCPVLPLPRLGNRRRRCLRSDRLPGTARHQRARPGAGTTCEVELRVDGRQALPGKRDATARRSSHRRHPRREAEIRRLYGDLRPRPRRR